MQLRHYKNPEMGEEIHLDEISGGYVMWYSDDKHPRYHEKVFNKWTRIPSWHRVTKRSMHTLRDFAIAEFDTMVSVQKDGIELRAMVARYEAQHCSLENLPLVLARRPDDKEMIEIAERRLQEEVPDAVQDS